MEKAVKKHKSHFSMVIEEFNAKAGKKNEWKTDAGHFGIGVRNRRGDQVF